MNELATISLSADDSYDTYSSDDIRLVERFQTLEPGHYWRRKGKSQRGLPHGIVLLLIDVVEFDGKPHTVKLALHPLEGDGEYEFLVGEFLDEWEFAPDGAQVRERELRKIQEEIVQANTELLEGQMNPALIAPAIQKDLDAWEAKRAKEAKVLALENGESPAALVQPTANSELMVRGGQVRTDLAFVAEHRLSQDDVAAIRVTVEREAVIAESKVRWLTTRTEAIASKVRSMTPFFKEKAAAALAQTSHVRRFTKELMKGLASLDLYTGKNVEVVTVKKGAPAPAGEVLTLMQRKLFI